MKIIRSKEIEKQSRPDGRTVQKFLQQELGREFSSWQFLYVVHPPKLKENLHSHNKSYEALYFLDEAKYKINGKDYEINNGDLVVFEPGDIHGAIPVNNEVRLFVIQAPAIIDDKQLFEK